MPRLKVPSMMRRFSDGAAELSVSGATVGEVLADLALTHPDLAERILDPSRGLSPAVHIFVGEEDARLVGGVDAPVGTDEVIVVVPAMAGGTGGGRHPILAR